MNLETNGVDTLPSRVDSFAAGLSRHWPRAKQWSLRLAEFGLVQGLVQLLTAVAGLLIVRTLAKQDYALYAIANSMQTMGSLLADLGIGIGLRSIGGRVWSDPERFGQLLSTAFHLRRRFAIFSLMVTVPFSGWMLWRNGASAPLLIGLCLCVIAGVYPLLGSAVFTSCLQLHGQYRRIQSLDFGNALLRLAVIAGLAMRHLNSLLACGVGVMSNWIQFVFSRRWARKHASIDSIQNQQDRDELVRLSVKTLPNAIFFCFQSQVTILIFTLFGSPNGIADITALGRISALFAVFSAIFTNILAPQFTCCQDSTRLSRLYTALVAGTSAMLGLFVLLTGLFPKPLLWLLGNKYALLEKELTWVVSAGCLAQIAAAMWHLNNCRGWITLTSKLYIPWIILAQAIAVPLLDFTIFFHVIIFSIVIAAAPIPLSAADAVIGLRGRSASTSSPTQCTLPPWPNK
ncbi:MAG: hypothetical protein L0Y58_16175 [Verrucomicrobia subdivision 3 bacterium]|nr:hypothetical protein [Limisphaerales bacterium]